MSKLQRLVLNHKGGTSEFIIKDENAPAFDEVQDKTEEEKAQARENIGAASADDLSKIDEALDRIIEMQNSLIGGDGA